MAVSHDNGTSSHASGSSSTSQASFNITHSVGAGARCAVVWVFSIAAADNGSSVTFNSVSMGAVAGGSASDTATEPGTVKAYFLDNITGQGGNVTVTVSRTNNATAMWAVVHTLNAASACSVAGVQTQANDAAMTEIAIDDGSPGTNSVRVAGAYGGSNSPPAVGTNSTIVGNNNDLGSFGCTAVRETTAGQGSRSVGCTNASDDRAQVAFAVREAPGPISGSCALVFAAGSSTLTGAGALAGSCALVLDGSGTLDLPSSELAGSCALVFGAGSSTLTGSGALLARALPTPFASDTFTDTAGTDLGSHTQDTGGGTWTRHTSFSGNAAVITDANRVRSDGGNGTVVLYHAAGTPNGTPTADYAVYGTFRYVGTYTGGALAGICARMSTSADTYYSLWYAGGFGDDQWELIKKNGGAQTTLASSNATLTTGTNYRLRLEVQGSAIRGYVDDVLTVEATDGAISAAGKAGLVWYADSATANTNTTGYHFDDFSGVVPLKVGYVGDSHLTTYQSSALLPSLVANNLSPLQNRAVFVVNEGVNSSHTGTGGSGWAPGAASNYLADAKTAFAAEGVTHVAIMLGTNDAGDTLAVSAATYETQLDAIVDDLVAAGYKVILHYPPWFNITDSADEGLGAAALARIEAYLPKIDARVNGTDTLRGDVLAFDYLEAHPTLMHSDGYHLLNTGKAAVAQLQADATHPLLTPPTLGLTATGTLAPAASGAMAGTAALAFGAGSSTLTGAGALAGSAALVLDDGASALTGAGTLAGSADLVFDDGASALTGAGTLAGPAGLVFAEGSSALTGSGVLAGPAAMAFAEGSSTLAGSGVLAGSGALAFGGAALPDLPTGSMLGAAALTFGEGASTLTGAGVLAGAAALVLDDGASTLTASGTLAGACALAFTDAAALTGSAGLAGTAALTFTLSATADVPSGETAGAAALAFGAGSSSLTGSGALAGTCALTLAGSATLVELGQPPVTSLTIDFHYLSSSTIAVDYQRALTVDFDYQHAETVDY